MDLNINNRSMSHESRELFLRVQPICHQIATIGSPESIWQFECLIDLKLENIKNNLTKSIVINDLKELLSFPLILLLKNKTFSSERHSLLEAIARCLKKIFMNSSDISWQFYEDSFLYLFKHLNDKENPQKVANIAEECKLEIIFAITALSNELSTNAISNFCSSSFLPPLGHAIFLLLQLAEKEKSSDLKVAAFHSIQALALSKHSLTEKEKNNLGGVFANFLPGISMTCTKVATIGEIQSHKVTVVALECWCCLVCLVMRDKFLITKDQHLGISETKRNLKEKLFPNVKQELCEERNSINKSDRTPRMKSVTIDSKWINATEGKLIILMNSLQNLTSHSHWKVRLKLISCAKQILENCRRSVSGGCASMIEVLITLSTDVESDVEKSAKLSLTSFQKLLTSKDQDFFLATIEERLFALICRMPTIAKSQDEPRMTSALNFITSCLSLLDSEEFLEVPIHIERLLRSLTIVLVYDLESHEYLQERILTEDPLEIIGDRESFCENFKYISSSSGNRVFNLCCELGKKGDASLLVDKCLDLFEETSLYRKEVLLILCGIVKGAAELCSSLKNSDLISDSIVSLLLNHNVFNLPLRTSQNQPRDDDLTSTEALVPSLSSSPSQSPLLEVIKSNVIITSNALRLLGFTLSAMGRGCCKYFSRVLCPILEKAGDANVIVASSAVWALEAVAEELETDLDSLIEASVPHFWFALSQKLKRLPDNPNAPQVLRFVLRKSKNHLSAFVEDLVDDVLTSLDSFHDESPLSLLTVLLAFVDSSLREKKIKSSQNEERMNETESSKSSDDDSLVVFLLQLDRDERVLKMEEMDDVEDGFRELHLKNKSPEEDESKMEEVDSSPSVPRRIEVVVSIMEKCSFLLFYKDRKVQLTILQIIEICCQLLNEYENIKLPAFHKIWKPLVLRLKDRDFVVLLKALKVCVLMIELSGDFLRKRCLKDLFPSLCYFLESQNSSSLSKVQGSGYYLTPAFKAQHHTLQHLPPLVKGLDLGVMESLDLLNVLVLYLDSRQPRVFIDLTTTAVSVIYNKYPDLVWHSLQLCSQPIAIPAPSKKLIDFKISGRKRDFLEVEEILKKLEDFCR